ncbi:MAG TPA: hypothetical protein H9745_00215 [Candidatus Agathobaculum stercoravium]|nr:hypothetical protein [Candidatus Agathobaculum stercoravium]
MSENQQPLTEQEQATAPAEAEQPDLPAGEDSTAAEGSEALAADEQPDIDPADVRIFGLRRVCFHFTAGGAAVGYIVCGLLGLLAENAPGTAIGDLAAKTPSVTICAIAFGVVGYLIGRRLDKKRRAEKEASLAAETTENPEA